MSVKPKTARLVGGFMRWCDESHSRGHPDRPRAATTFTLPAPNRRAADRLTIINTQTPGISNAPAARGNPIDAAILTMAAGCALDG